MGTGRSALSIERRRVPVGALSHVELWVPDLAAAIRSWG